MIPDRNSHHTFWGQEVPTPNGAGRWPLRYLPRSDAAPSRWLGRLLKGRLFRPSLGKPLEGTPPLPDDWVDCGTYIG